MTTRRSPGPGQQGGGCDRADGTAKEREGRAYEEGLLLQGAGPGGGRGRRFHRRTLPPQDRFTLRGRAASRLLRIRHRRELPSPGARKGTSGEDAHGKLPGTSGGKPDTSAVRQPDVRERESWPWACCATLNSASKAPSKGCSGASS